MLIRNLQREDLQNLRNAVLDMLIDTYMINFQLLREQCASICKEKLELLETYIEQGNAVVVGTFEGNSLIGFLWLYRHDYFGECRLHVNQIVVSTQYRGKGIGRQLMHEAEKQARSIGIETIDLFVSDVNLEAAKMYDSLGFETERRYMKKKV